MNFLYRVRAFFVFLVVAILLLAAVGLVIAITISQQAPSN